MFRSTKTLIPFKIIIKHVLTLWRPSLLTVKDKKNEAIFIRLWFDWQRNLFCLTGTCPIFHFLALTADFGCLYSGCEPLIGWVTCYVIALAFGNLSCLLPFKPLSNPARVEPVKELNPRFRLTRINLEKLKNKPYKYRL